MENLIERAREEGIRHIEVCALVHINDALLLVEHRHLKGPSYDLISTALRPEETISQALLRAVMHETGDQIQEIESYLGHQDFDEGNEKGRRFLFTVTLEEPYEIWAGDHIAYAWKNYKEAVGYPITDDVRTMIDLFGKWRESL